MARVFEHEYFGHGGIKTGVGADGGPYTMGRAVKQTNVFRRQRGLNQRLHYGWGSSVIFFGDTNNYKNAGAQRKAVKKMASQPLSNQLFMKIHMTKKK